MKDSALVETARVDSDAAHGNGESGDGEVSLLDWDESDDGEEGAGASNGNRVEHHDLCLLSDASDLVTHDCSNPANRKPDEQDKGDPESGLGDSELEDFVEVDGHVGRADDDGGHFEEGVEPDTPDDWTGEELLEGSG